MADPMNIAVTQDAPLQPAHVMATRSPTITVTVQYSAPTPTEAKPEAAVCPARAPNKDAAPAEMQSAQQGVARAERQLPEDVFAAMATLHNAIVRGDAIEARDVLVKHPSLRDQVMPHGCSLAQWVTHVLLHFDDHGDIPDDRDKRIHFHFRREARNPLYHNEERYLQVPSTPLVRAVEVGARNVVKVLLDLGAKAEPSLEALLSRAINHLYENKIFVCRAVHTEESSPMLIGEPAMGQRASDWLGILADLLAAFERTPGRLSPIDANPLFVLRVTSLCRAKSSLGFDEPSTAFSDEETLERLRTALKLLLNAGYSPDEVMSETPQEQRFTGYPYHDDYEEDDLEGPKAKDGSDIVWPVMSSERMTKHRRGCQTMTEREGVLLTRDMWSRGAHHGDDGGDKLRDDIIAAIIATYAQIPPT